MNIAILVTIAMVVMATHAEENVKQAFSKTDEVDGELNLDHHYYEGDIRLTHKQQDVLTKSNDGLYSRALVKNVELLWPNGVIPYVINPTLRAASKSFILSAVREWNTRTCIKLIPKNPSHENYVEFVYEGGCSSNLGMVGGKQTISVGGIFATCKHGNIVHEIAHTVGFFHEHSRPDRNSYIKVIWERIKPGFKFNFNKMPEHMIDSHDVGYDYDSVTHYGPKFFSKDGSSPTIITTQPVPANAVVGQRVRLSDLDVKQANLLYGCSARKSKIETPQNSDNKESEKKIAESHDKKAGK